MNRTRQSDYLKEAKPLLKKLLAKLLETYPYASILACDSESRTYSVAKSGIQISDDSRWGTRGFCVKAFDGHGYCEHAFTAISEDNIPQIITEVENNSR